MYLLIPYASSAFFAIAKVPSKVSLPPINPLACTKTPPGMPEISDNLLSLIPLKVRGGFAVDKGIGRFGDTLDAPFGRSFGFGVKDVEDRGGSLWKGGLEGEKMVFPWARLVKCLALVSVKRQETRDLVKYNDSTAGMHFRPLFQSFFHDIPSWQPSESKVVQL